MAISFTPAKINRGLIKKAAKTTGFMTSVLNRINTDRQNAREDARNKELDAQTTRKLDIEEERNRLTAEAAGIKTKAQQQENKILAQTAQGNVDTGLQFYNKQGELESYYLPTLKGKVGTKYTQKDFMTESRMQLGRILQDLQGENAKGILKAISESPTNWQNYVIDKLETASQKEDLDDGGFSYNGLIMRDFKGYNDIEKFQDLFNAFKTLENKDGSLQDYALELFDERFGMNEALKSTAAGMNYSIVANKTDPSVMNMVLYGKGFKKPDDLSEEDFKALGTNFGRQVKENKKLNTVLSLAKSSGMLSSLNQDSVAVAHLILENKDMLGLDDIINNAGGSKATDLRIKELVKNLQLTTSVINEEVGFAGVQPLGLRETNAEALILAVMAEKHIGNQYNVERTKDGIKATPLKPNIPIETKDIEYYTLVKNSSSDTINTTNELFDINQQIARIEGGKPFRLGSKLGSAVDFTTVTEEVLKQIPQVVATIFRNSEEINTYDAVVRNDLSEYSELNGQNFARLTDAKEQYTKNMTFLSKRLETESNDNLKKVYMLRMRAEGIKVRTAFRIASLVQGGGRGGGRTISNQDFEVIYNSLFKTPGTPEAFTAAMAQVRHEMLKQKVAADTYLEYRQFGFTAANDAVDLAKAYLDAQMSEHYQTGNAYNAVNFLDEIPETLITSVQRNDMVGIFGRRTFFDENNPGNYTHKEGDVSYLTDLGIKKGSIEFLMTSVDKVFEDGKVTDDERKQVAGMYAATIVPLLVKDREDRGFPTDKEELKKDLIKFQFGNAFADLMLDRYESVGASTKKQDTDLNKFRNEAPPEEISSDIPEQQQSTITVPIFTLGSGGQEIKDRNLEITNENSTIGNLSIILGQNQFREKISNLPFRPREYTQAFQNGYIDVQKFLDERKASFDKYEQQPTKGFFDFDRKSMEVPKGNATQEELNLAIYNLIKEITGK